MKRIAVVGSLNMDLVVTVPYLPKIGETILAKTFKQVPGGKGANQACAIAKLGGNVHMFGKVGMDQHSKVLLDSLQSVGVNLKGVKKTNKTHTGLALININADGDNNIVVASGANGDYEQSDFDEHLSLFDQCDIVLVQLEIPLTTVFHVVGVAAKLKKTIILNPAPAPEHLSDDILRSITCITPNRNELERLTNMIIESDQDVKEAARKLIKRGVESVVVTLGDQGAAMVDSYNYKIFPSIPVRVVDTTAAGDTFSGALAVYLAKGSNLLEAIRFANIAAAITVSREGAQPSIPYINEVSSFIK